MRECVIVDFTTGLDGFMRSRSSFVPEIGCILERLFDRRSLMEILSQTFKCTSIVYVIYLALLRFFLTLFVEVVLTDRNLTYKSKHTV